MAVLLTCRNIYWLLQSSRTVSVSLYLFTLNFWFWFTGWFQQTRNCRGSPWKVLEKVIALFDKMQAFVTYLYCMQCPGFAKIIPADVMDMFLYLCFIFTLNWSWKCSWKGYWHRLFDIIYSVGLCHVYSNSNLQNTVSRRLWQIFRTATVSLLHFYLEFCSDLFADFNIHCTCTRNFLECPSKGSWKFIALFDIMTQAFAFALISTILHLANL